MGGHFAHQRSGPDARTAKDKRASRSIELASACLLLPAGVLAGSGGGLRKVPASVLAGIFLSAFSLYC